MNGMGRRSRLEFLPPVSWFPGFHTRKVGPDVRNGTRNHIRRCGIRVDVDSQRHKLKIASS